MKWRKRINNPANEIVADLYLTKAALREAFEQEEEADDSEMEVIGKRRESDEKTLNLDSRRVARLLLTEDDSSNYTVGYVEEVNEAVIQDLQFNRMSSDQLFQGAPWVLICRRATFWDDSR